MEILNITSKKQNVREGGRKFRSFRMCYKLMTASLNIYIYRLLYMNPMVITNWNPKIDHKTRDKGMQILIKKIIQPVKKLKEK